MYTSYYQKYFYLELYLFFVYSSFTFNTILYPTKASYNTSYKNRVSLKPYTEAEFPSYIPIRFPAGCVVLLILS